MINFVTYLEDFFFLYSVNVFYNFIILTIFSILKLIINQKNHATVNKLRMLVSNLLFCFSNFNI